MSLHEAHSVQMLQVSLNGLKIQQAELYGRSGATSNGGTLSCISTGLRLTRSPNEGGWTANTTQTHLSSTTNNIDPVKRQLLSGELPESKARTMRSREIRRRSISGNPASIREPHLALVHFWLLHVRPYAGSPIIGRQRLFETRRKFPRASEKRELPSPLKRQ